MKVVAVDVGMRRMEQEACRADPLPTRYGAGEEGKHCSRALGPDD